MKWDGWPAYPATESANGRGAGTFGRPSRREGPEFIAIRMPLRQWSYMNSSTTMFL